MFNIAIRKSLGTFQLDARATSNARILGLVGESGSGKTSLLNCIAGWLEPDEGLVEIAGRTLVESSARSRGLAMRRRGVGYVVQDGWLFPHMTVEKNLRYGLGAHGLPPDFSELVRMLELDHLFGRSAASLSGGENRRVAVGRALLTGPRVLLLDEPLTGLDRRLARSMLAYLHRVLRAIEVPTIFVSHNISDVLFLCEDAWLVDGGRIIATGPPRKILSAAPMRGTSALDDVENLFLATVAFHGEDHTVFTVGGQQLITRLITARPGAESILGVSGSDIMLASNRPVGISARNVLRGNVTSVNDSGTQPVVIVDVGTEWVVPVTRAAIRELDIAKGSEIIAIVKASAIHVSHAGSNE